MKDLLHNIVHYYNIDTVMHDIYVINVQPMLSRMACVTVVVCICTYIYVQYHVCILKCEYIHSRVYNHVGQIYV